MSTGFKKRVVTADRVADVETAAAFAPIVGDPRMISAQPPAAKKDSTAGRNDPPVHQGEGFNSQPFSDKSATIAEYEIGRVYDVPIEQIKSNPLNPRAVYTTTAVDAMAMSLASGGQRISATAYLGENGDVVLIEGETRLRGARVSGIPTLRVEIKKRPASDQDLYEEARAANVERRDQTPLDDALRWKELLAKKVYPTQVALAKALNIREDVVSRTCNLATMPSRLIHAAAETPELLSLKMLTAIREFWEIKGDEDTLELIIEVARTGMGHRDVVARRKAAATGSVKRPRALREVLSYQGAKGELKSFEEEGRVELSLKGLSVEAAQEITSKIKALFIQS